MVESRPGYVWIDGYWYRDGNSWSWSDGYSEAQRPRHSYVQGRWERDGSRWLWNPGRWRVAEGRREVAPAHEHRQGREGY